MEERSTHISPSQLVLFIAVVLFLKSCPSQNELNNAIKLGFIYKELQKGKVPVG